MINSSTYLLILTLNLCSHLGYIMFFMYNMPCGISEPNIKIEMLIVAVDNSVVCELQFRLTCWKHILVYPQKNFEKVRSFSLIQDHILQFNPRVSMSLVIDFFFYIVISNSIVKNCDFSETILFITAITNWVPHFWWQSHKTIQWV